MYAQDFSIAGGTLGEAEGDKIISLMDKALELRIPIVAMLDSGGARIQEGAWTSQYGRIFRSTVEASGVIPQISVIVGPCAGGAVYCPALTDFIVMTLSMPTCSSPVRMWCARPPARKCPFAGGAAVHNFQSGVAHYQAEDEADALDYTRALLTYLPSNCDAPAPLGLRAGPEDFINAQSIAALVPESSKQPYDMVEVIRHLVDYGEFVQVQELFAPSIVVGFACFNGESVGIVANQPLHEAGTLDADVGEVRTLRAVLRRLQRARGDPRGTRRDTAPEPSRSRPALSAVAPNSIVYANASVPLVTVVLRSSRRCLPLYGLQGPRRRHELRLARRGNRRARRRRRRGHHRPSRTRQGQG